MVARSVFLFIFAGIGIVLALRAFILPVESAALDNDPLRSD